MRPNPEFPADLVTFTEEILNGKLHFLFSVIYVQLTFCVQGKEVNNKFLIKTLI